MPSYNYIPRIHIGTCLPPHTCQQPKQKAFLVDLVHDIFPDSSWVPILLLPSFLFPMCAGVTSWTPTTSHSGAYAVGVWTSSPCIPRTPPPCGRKICLNFLPLPPPCSSTTQTNYTFCAQTTHYPIVLIYMDLGLLPHDYSCFYRKEGGRGERRAALLLELVCVLIMPTTVYF